MDQQSPLTKQPPRTITISLNTFLDILWRSQDSSTQDLEIATQLMLADPAANTFHLEWLVDKEGKPRLCSVSRQPLCNIWRKHKWIETERKRAQDKFESDERNRKVAVRREFIIKLANKIQARDGVSDRDAALTMALAIVNYKLPMITESQYGLIMPQEMIDDPEKYTHMNTLA